MLYLKKGEYMSKNTNATTAKSEKTELVFTVKQLRQHALKLFGVTVSTFDGAAYGLAEDAKFTVNEMAEKIRQWQSKEVK